jgi:hypothetical protein
LRMLEDEFVMEKSEQSPLSNDERHKVLIL